MENIYGQGKVCKENGECLPLEPDLVDIMGTSRDHCELQWAWEGWRNVSGREMRGYFTNYVHLQNEAAQYNGFKNAKEMWTKFYWNDEPEFFDQIEESWKQIQPLYEKLHAYVRHQLKQVHPQEIFPDSGQIPAHLLGNMWAQSWINIFEYVLPDKDAEAIDITKLLMENNINATYLYNMADDFFQSIGMDPMTDDFWEKSILLKPNDREMICHASAWDFFRWSDFRIKQCTTVTQQQFQTVHHEMGHIQYFMNYKEQPAEFRNGANPGFHEAIGDLIALSVMTPDHLKTIGLLDEDYDVSEGTYLNSMMNMALKKIAFLPFGYLMDKYRWDVFEKTTSLYDLNAGWWNDRCDIQGVSPPVVRTENDFDAGAKYHTPASVPYIRYFFSHVVQFQYHQHLCEKLGFTKDFHKCDIYGHPEIMEEFSDAMSWGQSKKYPEAMLAMTGEENLNAEPLLNYFKPLEEFLDRELAKAGVTPGWKTTCSKPKLICTYKQENGGDDDDGSGSSQLTYSFTLFAMAILYAINNLF